MVPDAAPPAPQPDLTPSLVARLRAGEDEAGRALNQLYHEAIVRFCRSYLGTIEEAEDAAQEVFCNLLRTRFVPDNFRAWLYRLARNQCLNVLRKRRNIQALPAEDALEADLTGVLSRLTRKERESHAVQVVAKLPQAQREALSLRYGEGLSRQEIAYVLGLNESLVKSRLFEGLKRLRDHGSLDARA